VIAEQSKYQTVTLTKRMKQIVDLRVHISCLFLGLSKLFSHRHPTSTIFSGCQL